MAGFTQNKPGQASELATSGKSTNPNAFGPFIKRYWQLYALLALPLLYLLVFKYAPMIYNHLKLHHQHISLFQYLVP